MLWFGLAVLFMVVLAVASDRGVIDGYNALGFSFAGIAFGGVVWLAIELIQLKGGL